LQQAGQRAGSIDAPGIAMPVQITGTSFAFNRQCSGGLQT
jgi:hypothetical protein